MLVLGRLTIDCAQTFYSMIFGSNLRVIGGRDIGGILSVAMDKTPIAEMPLIKVIGGSIPCIRVLEVGILS